MGVSLSWITNLLFHSVHPLYEIFQIFSYPLISFNFSSYGVYAVFTISQGSGIKELVGESRFYLALEGTVEKVWSKRMMERIWHSGGSVFGYTPHHHHLSTYPLILPLFTGLSLLLFFSSLFFPFIYFHHFHILGSWLGRRSNLCYYSVDISLFLWF